MPIVYYKDLKTIEYKEAWDLQEELLKSGVDYKSARRKNPEQYSRTLKNHLFFCSHPHVYTLGRHGNKEHLLFSDEQMRANGISFYKTNRGGDITYHGPGQLVAYPVLDLDQFFTDIRRYMRSLEEVVIQVLADYGIKGDRINGATGVWLDALSPDKARKICAMGVRCSRWITIHGLALNMNTDLDYFKHIVPCGISDKGVASMHTELGHAIDEAEVKHHFLEKFATVFEAELHSEEKIPVDTINTVRA